MPEILIHRRALPVALSVLLLAAAACGGTDQPADESVDTTAAGAGSTASPDLATGSSADAAAPLTSDDIDRYDRGLRAELQAMRDAKTHLTDARTGMDSVQALAEAGNVDEAGARGAGVSVDRYRVLEERLGGALARRVMGPGMQQMAASIDTSDIANMPAEQQAQLRASMQQMQAAFGDSAMLADLPAGIHDDFRRAAASSLDSLWRERMTLLGGIIANR